MEVNSAVLVALLLGYGLGSFPTGVILSKSKYRIDVREMGSGNIGATNVTRVFGWWAGALTLMVDVAKGAFPLLFIRTYWPGEEALMAYFAVALVLGHCFSGFLRFRGGKGVATSFGCLLVMEPVLAGMALLAYAIGLGLTRISAVGSLGAILVCLLYGGFVELIEPTWWLIMAISAIVLMRHYSNIRRLLGLEPSID